MGIFDAAARTLKFVTDRMQPSYSPPAARPADPAMHVTNGDDSVAYLRGFVTSGPARTAPVRDSGAGDVPSPTDSRFQSAVDRRGSNQYPRTDGASTVNTDGRSATAMPYGTQAAVDRPETATTISIRGDK